ncbi:MAG: glycoside hydrolase family 78 protein [Prevotellaceae bacterium]|nr:glycoside hydrolase family 78 protein [Prevotellaceae bacterium]
MTDKCTCIRQPAAGLAGRLLSGRIIFPILFAVLSLAGTPAFAGDRFSVEDLRCEHLINPLSIDTPHPELAWKLKTGVRGLKQTAYRILVATEPSLLNEGKADLWDSGKTQSDAQSVKYAGKDLTGEKAVYWKVRIWDSRNGQSRWSRTAHFGAGLTAAELDAAEYIGFPKDMLPADGTVCPLFRKQFNWTGGEKALLYVNSLGYHELYVNGVRAGDKVLEPAVSQYDKRSLYITYDITPQLKKGANELTVWLGSGWYKHGLPGVASRSPLLKARLEALRKGEWQTLALTGESWQTCLSGYSDLGNWRFQNFVGERVDAALVPADFSAASISKLKWLPVEITAVPEHAVSPQMTEGNSIGETLHPQKIIPLSDGSWMIDFGKAVIGWAEIRFPQLRQGQEIVIEYAEHLDDKGNIARQNQTDRYIASGQAGEVFRNRFTYRGFRYITVSGLGTAPEAGSLKSLSIFEDTGAESSFSCSDSDMNAIHDMIHHTLRCLSAGGYILGDASYERLGYGGDGLASTATAQMMFNLAPLYANWMNAWADCMQPDGGLPHTAPCPYNAGGGPYWCGFVVMAPWSAYVNYGSVKLLERHYPLMQKWLEYVEKHMTDGLLQGWPNVKYRSRGWFLGDWASPKGVNDNDPKSVEVINNSFICICYGTASKIAALLGKAEDAKRYAAMAETLRKLIHERCFDSEKNIYGSGSQADLAFAMLASVPPEKLLPEIKQSLYDETVQRHGGHIACGLTGIPALTEWTVKNRTPDFMYSMLKKKDTPGYLYMIENGATATWEHWSGARSHVHNCFNGIGLWFYQAVGGIRPDESAPGYKRAVIDPQVPKGISWAKTAVETPYGRLSLNWTLKERIMEMELTVPPGSSASVRLPEKTERCAVDGVYFDCGQNHSVELDCGTYRVSYTLEN